jgi:myo-inositol 2-dehydrogenase/D-chiro-inositol 1-dehydrogenase
MPKPLKVAVAGLGRIGKLHSRHVYELGQETGECRLEAVVDSNPERARQYAERYSAKAFLSVEEMAASGVAEATVIGTPTDCHRSHAATLIGAGQRVLLEKPLTGSLDEDRAFARELNERHPNAVMLAFQRRFDEPLQLAKQWMEEGRIGRVFKIASILEDSNPAPDGYTSLGILADMSVHNVDEILWLTGQMPAAAASIGTCLYSRRLSTAVEDFDDGFLYMWFPCELAAQVQVTRNHVSGYRVETWIFGEKGQIHIGRFEQKPLEVVVEAYGRSEPLGRKAFTMRDYGEPLPEFADRFGPAYKAEAAEFVRRCLDGSSFPVTHNDGLRAMEVIDAGMRGAIGVEQGGKVTAA